MPTSSPRRVVEPTDNRRLQPWNLVPVYATELVMLRDHYQAGLAEMRSGLLALVEAMYDENGEREHQDWMGGPGTLVRSISWRGGISEQAASELVKFLEDRGALSRDEEGQIVLSFGL